MDITSYYENIIDLPSVDGLLVLSRIGETVYDRLPKFIPREDLGNIVRRVASLYDTVDENYLSCDDYILRYPEKSLIFRRNNVAILMILCAPDLNLPSLRMVSNLALKNTDEAAMERLQAAPDSSGEGTPVVAEAPPPAPPEPEPEPAAPARKTRFYRGQAY